MLSKLLEILFSIILGVNVPKYILQMFLELLETGKNFLYSVILSLSDIVLIVSDYRFKPIKCWTSEVGDYEENFICFIPQLLPVDLHVQFQLYKESM